MNFEALITELNECVEYNCHAEAYMIAADWLATNHGDDRADALANEFESIANEQVRAGYLTEELNTKREAARARLNAVAKELLSEEDYNQIRVGM